MAEHPKKKPLWDLATGDCLMVFPVDLREIVKVNSTKFPGRYSVTAPTQAQVDEYRRTNPEPEKTSQPAARPRPLPLDQGILQSLDDRIAEAEVGVDDEPESPGAKAKLAALLFERGTDEDKARAQELLAAAAKPAGDEGADGLDDSARQEALIAAMKKMNPDKDFPGGKPDKRKLKARLDFSPSDEEIGAALEALTAQ